MQEHERLEQLLEEWSVDRERGIDRSPVDVCADCPELEAEFRRRIRIISRFERLGMREAGVTAVGQSDVDTSHDSRSESENPEREAELPESIGGFRTVKLLGEGGMGAVYLAEDPQLSRQVAVKVMKTALAADGNARQRFLREARAMAAIDHDNIMTIHSVGEDRGIPFLVMPALKGESLENRLVREERLPISECCRIGREIAEGLAAAHSRGLIHRDIKPGNIWLEGRQGRVRILDFGLARPARDDQRVTQSGAILGTPSYMAPEQAAGEEATTQSDLFSLGTMLYRMTTGVQPFAGPNLMATLTNLANTTPRSPQQIHPEIPAELSSLIEQLMSKAPAQRPESAESVAERLRTLDREGVVPRTQPAPATTQSQASAVPSRASGKRPPGRFSRIFLTASLGGLGLFLAVLVYRIVTDKGVLELQIEDDQVQARLGADGLVIEDSKTGRAWKLKPQVAQTVPSGDYRLPELRGLELFVQDESGAEFATREFTIRRGNRITVRVTLVRDAAEEQSVTKIVEGQGGHALEFDGVDDSVIIPGISINPNEAYTFEVWAMARSPGTVANLHCGVDLTIWRALDHPSWGATAIFPPGDVTQGALRINSVAVEPFQHLAAVIDPEKQNLTFFIDGKVVETTQSGIKQPVDLDNKLLLGVSQEQGNWVGHLAGQIRAARISRGVRYSGPFTPSAQLEPDDDTIALYRFSEGKGLELRDSSGNNYHGEIRGPNWTAISRDLQPAVGWHGWPADAPKPAIAPFDEERAKQHQKEWADYLQVPVEYTNSVGMNFLLIPPGEFQMGSSPREIHEALTVARNQDGVDAIRGESPVHRVFLPAPFYAGAFEVTQKQYETVIGRNPSVFSASGSAAALVAGKDTSEHPVDAVNWYDAIRLCIRLDEQEQRSPHYVMDAEATVKTGREPGYRLLSEAEWEYVCRGGNADPVLLEGRDPQSVMPGWYLPIANAQTHPVGQLKPNSLGLYDLHGNVWEWVEDWYQADYYREFTNVPATSPRGPVSGVKKIFRGGSWSDPAGHCRAANRGGFDPRPRIGSFGVRLAVSVEAVRDVLSRKTQGKQ